MSPQVLFINLNEIPTKILIYDDSKTYQFNSKFHFDRLILMITGNPGEIEYYHQFLSEIQLQTKLPVIGISNSGHNLIPENLTKPELNKKNLSKFGLHSQISYKAKFIQDFIEPSSRLILLGHSIGCYVILELLDSFDDIKKMVDHSIMIFPTIDSIGNTPYGRKINFLFKYCYYPLIALAYCFEFLLSKEAQEKFLATYLKWNGYKNIPQFVVKSATNLFNPYFLKIIITMVLDEFRYVGLPKINVIKSNAEKLSMFFGEADHWAPVKNYYYLQKKLENCLDSLDLRLCLGKIDHAFVMEPESCDKICNLTLEVIKKKWNI